MKEKAELALKSSKWGEVAGGAIQGLGTVVNSTVDTIKSVWTNLWGGSKEEATAADTSAPSAISVLPNTQYTVPLNSIASQVEDIKEYTNLTSQKLGSQTATLVSKLSELSDKLSDIIEVMGATANNSSGPTSFFRGVDIEA